MTSADQHESQNHKTMAEKKTFTQRIIDVQNRLKAPKSQYNKFGKYKYRKAEDILNEAKPLLAENELLLTISDEVVIVANRIYVKATATITDGCSNEKTATAWAREDEKITGMQGAQVTGSTSSYARKYALNGLFLIDDTQDADATNTHGKEENKQQEAPQVNDPFLVDKLIEEMEKAKDRVELTNVWRSYPELQTDPRLGAAAKRIGAKFPKK